MASSDAPRRGRKRTTDKAVVDITASVPREIRAKLDEMQASIRRAHYGHVSQGDLVAALIHAETREGADLMTDLVIAMRQAYPNFKG